MNVTFHILGSIATAAALSPAKNESFFSTRNLARCGIGFLTGILVHGLLDYLPHEYPFQSKLDIVFGISMLAITLFVAHSRNYSLILACFAGCLFPDVVDLGPAIANKHLGIPLPQLAFKIFPWHWKEFSGSLYSGERRAESTAYHLIFVATCALLIYSNRNRLLR